MKKPVDQNLTPEPMDPWAGRRVGMRCRTCLSFCMKKVPIGRCRKHAATMGGFPVVYENDWCGDHRLDEDSVVPSPDTP